MSRRAGQLIALFAITFLVVVAIWYQSKQDTRLQSSVLNNQYGYGYNTGSSITGSTGSSASSLAENRPQFSSEENGIKVHKYLISYDSLTVLDGLQVPLQVPSLSTNVLWIADNASASSIIIDDENSARTAFIAPGSDDQLDFLLQVEDSSGVYQTVAKYQFIVVSDIAFAADVNKDGIYDFQNDLVNLLRNWDSFGNDATRTLALILSRLEE